MTTAQEIFDSVLHGLREQGRGSYDAQGCKYRGPLGLKCAVGMRMPDEVYAAGLEGIAVSRQFASMLPDSQFKAEITQFMPLFHALQAAHDRSLGSARSLRVWEQEMGDVAEQFNLRYESPYPREKRKAFVNFVSFDPIPGFYEKPQVEFFSLDLDEKAEKPEVVSSEVMTVIARIQRGAKVMASIIPATDWRCAAKARPIVEPAYG